jgi:hypothetical protein
VKTFLVLNLAILIFCPYILAENSEIITSLEEAHNYVYFRSNQNNWYKNKPVFCSIIKGGYLIVIDKDLDTRHFYGFGVIAAESWDALKLKEDVVYKEGQTFVIERNVCLFPNYRLNSGLDWGKYKKNLFKESRDARDAKIVRVREAVSMQGEYNMEILEVISENPPLAEIFYCD